MDVVLSKMFPTGLESYVDNDERYCYMSWSSNDVTLQYITSEVFTACLIDLSKALWEVMKSYHKTMQWHEQHEGEEAAAENSSPGTRLWFKSMALKLIDIFYLT